MQTSSQELLHFLISGLLFISVIYFAIIYIMISISVYVTLDQNGRGGERAFLIIQSSDKRFRVSSDKRFRVNKNLVSWER